LQSSIQTLYILYAVITESNMTTFTINNISSKRTTNTATDTIQRKQRRRRRIQDYNDYNYSIRNVFIKLSLLPVTLFVCQCNYFPSCHGFLMEGGNITPPPTLFRAVSFIPTCLQVPQPRNSNDRRSCSRSSNNMSVLRMAKGDGKKSRKKKSDLPPPPSTASIPSVPTPQRVSNDINIPVRHQIRWGKMKKEAERNSGTAFRQTNIKKRTAYRKSLDEEEIEEARLERKKRGQDVDWDVILNATMVSPLVMVDAYNVIYKWPRLKKWMTKGVLSRARDLLIYDLEELSALKGWRIEVVFDGFGRSTTGALGDGPGRNDGSISRSDAQASKKTTQNGVRVVYSGVGMSADGYIEQRCFEAKKVTDGRITGSLIVTSDDNMIRNAAINAGAICMSSERMVNELKSLRKSAMYRVEAALEQERTLQQKQRQQQQQQKSKINNNPSPTNNNNQHKNPNSTHTSSSSSTLNGMSSPGGGNPNSVVYRGSVIIEDKRNRKRQKEKEKAKIKDAAEKSKVTLDELKKGTKSVPSWAVRPDIK
jgi:predicted RNA-binding protein with PIN domain